jgi:hypothetical protein
MADGEGAMTEKDLPRPVGLASVVLLACAIATLLVGLTSMVALVHLAGARDAYLAATGPDGGEVLSALRSTLVLNTGIGVVAAVLLAGLGFAVRRPWQPARVAAWCVTTAVVTTTSCVLATSPELMATPNAQDPIDLQRATANLLPAWYPDVYSLLSAGLFAGLIAVALLLMRTSAADFYRQPSQTGAPGLWNFARPGDAPSPFDGG